MYQKLLSMVAIVLLVFTVVGCGIDGTIETALATLEQLESTEETQLQTEKQQQEETQQAETQTQADTQSQTENQPEEETQSQTEIQTQEEADIHEEEEEQTINIPLQDAQAAFEKCKESYEYYEKVLAETATTTLEMVECTQKMYETSDECLNYIWGLIRKHVEEEQFEPILAKQRAWLEEKEKRASELPAMSEGGSLAAVDYNYVLADMTYERCEELIEYLK